MNLIRGLRRLSSFQIILLNSDQRGNDDTAGRKPGQDISSPDIRQKLRPENEADDTQDGKNNWSWIISAPTRC